MYKKYEGKDNTTWYIKIDDLNLADHIYVDTHDPKSQGFGGSTLKFELEDGNIDEVKGPWHSNSKALLDRTRINIVDLHYTKVVLTKVRNEIYAQKYNGLIYEEKEFVLGPFYRGDRIAHEYADTTGETVYCITISNGGGSGKMISPNSEYRHPLSKRKDD